MTKLISPNFFRLRAKRKSTQKQMKRSVYLNLMRLLIRRFLSRGMSGGLRLKPRRKKKGMLEINLMSLKMFRLTRRKKHEEKIKGGACSKSG